MSEGGEEYDDVVVKGDVDETMQAEEEKEEEDEEIKSKRTRRRGQRAIGVVYNPEYERYGNYVPTILDKRYDAFLFVDKTHALHPVHMPEVKENKEEFPETFPTGL